MHGHFGCDLPDIVSQSHSMKFGILATPMKSLLPSKNITFSLMEGKGMITSILKRRKIKSSNIKKIE